MPTTEVQDNTNLRAQGAGPFVAVPETFVEQIEALYDQQLCLRVYDLTKTVGPLHRWTGASARRMAGRLAANLGGYRLSNVLHWLAWRSDRHDPDLLAYHSHTILQRRGPLLAYELLERYGGEPSKKTPDGQVHLATVRATVAAQLRDFESAHTYLRHASTLIPDYPWVATAQSHVLELEDRYPEALEAARRALELRAWYRPGVQAAAHMLQLLDRDEEALSLLKAACSRIENVHVARQLAGLQTELGYYDDALATLQRIEELAPLIEKPEKGWLERQRVTLHCLRRDWPAALVAAKPLDEEYYKGLGARLESGHGTRQVKLDVPFVRQHHLTCAPATLSALSRFWNQPAEHLEVAEAICYDGTPAHSERHWAESHGWHTREFTVTWDSAVALLDRGVPFTLTSTGAASAHLQAVIGYDELRQTLWIRDPFVYYTGEVIAEPFFKAQRSSGPRGMAMVPRDQRGLLDGLDLQDAALWDQLHALDRALAQHRRSEAVTLLQTMETTAPQHRLTLCGRRAFACYDANSPALLDCFDLLLKQFPDDETLTLAKLGCLRELARRPERLQLLEQLSARKGVDPVFWQQYAQELRMDARQAAAAQSWSRWALRYRPADPSAVSTWADLLWDDLKFEEATRFYCVAACLADKNEGFARSFFIACCHLRKTEVGLAFLKSRAERLGGSSSAPSSTLVGSLQHLRRTQEALDALDAALIRRPNDGPLLLYAADLYARHLRAETAQRLLREAVDHCTPTAWHRTAAAIAGYRNLKNEALQHWREVLKLEPLAHDAIDAATLLLAETEGHGAALQFLDEMCSRFPFSCPLLALRIRWRSEDGTATVIPLLRQLLEVNPADSWAWRELALELSNSGKQEEGMQAADEGIRIEPHASTGFSVRAQLLLHEGKIPEARMAFREAIRLEVDNAFALERYVTTAPTFAERKQALTEIAEELRRQVIFKDALTAYRETARGLLPPEEVLALLRDAHAARPDLWQSWSVLIQQLADMGRHDEALALAEQATSRFPLLPGAWADLALVEQGRLDEAAESVALQKALELNPNFAVASRRLAGICQRNHKLAEARATLERAIAANPLDPVNQACLADVLWLLNERGAAIEQACNTIRLNPGYQRPWNLLSYWAPEVDRPELAADMARELTKSRPDEARSWLMLAHCLLEQPDSQELPAALDRALALNPRSEDAYDLRARALAQLNRFDEALAQCEPADLKPTPPTLLLRAAWLEAERRNLPRAIARAKAALEEHPDQYGGWQMLADWHTRSGQLEDAIKAAEKMAALAPLEPVPLGYLGDLKLRSGDEQGARAVFERAFSLDPNYSYAGGRLFHLHLGEQHFEKAGSILEIMERRGDTPQTLYCRICLGATTKEPASALTDFKKLCAHEEVDLDALEQAAGVLDAGTRKQIDDYLGQQLTKNDTLPVAAAFWVKRQMTQHRWNLHKRLATLSGELRRQAVFAYLDALGEHITRTKKEDFVTYLALRHHFHRLRQTHGAWLREDHEAWGRVGYVLSSIGKPKPVVEWLSDWRRRPQAPSWALYNLMLVFQQLRRYDECRELAEHAVGLRHADDQSYADFCITAAFEDALAGNLDSARKYLATIPADSSPLRHQTVRKMTELLLEISGPSQPQNLARKRIKGALKQLFDNRPPCEAEKYVRDGYHRFLKAASQQVGSLGLWGTWFYRGTRWLMYPLIIALIPAAAFFPGLLIVIAVCLYFMYVKRSR